MSIATLKIAAIASLAVGGGLTVFSFFVPGIEKGREVSEAPQYAVYTNDTAATWSTIPGNYSYNINWAHYLYPVANYLRVSQRA
jgi:hypothetical protein